MSKGIASVFKQKFSKIDKLLKFNPLIGKCNDLDDNQRKIFYLVTKQNFYDKPIDSDLESSLKDLRKLCERLKVTMLAIPKIGCELYKLDWDIVAQIIYTVFKTSTTQITVYFRHSLFNSSTQTIVNNYHTIPKIASHNTRNTIDFNNVNLR